ncbi:ParM/StbA family protein [Fusibacter tunisiensis]|uniref:Plasmid segregation protein ParM n=1 Tax=Fusibacter tunisiensis TaxID=1008308 RepID=A0ABS2MT54_9FIRM|nr:ParM/StbA family protein [Fusibacter tunisiensis]MBM7562616.1 plasmid segregation protein ParM [Fusibacter tunisiensis]
MYVKVIVDAGKFNTKVITERGGQIKKAIYRTKAMPTQEEKSTNRGNFVVEIPGLEDPSFKNKVMFGKSDAVFSVDYDREKKKDIHKIAIYTAIADSVSPGDVVTDVIVGYPISLFKNVNARNDFADYIKGDGKVEMKLNGVPIHFYIEKVTVLPESSGIILARFKEFKRETVAVLDFGGLNVNGCIFQNGDIVEGTYFTLDKGVYILKERLKDALNYEFGVNIQDYLMDKIIKEGFIKKDKEKSESFIKKFIAEYMQEVKSQAIRAQWDFDVLSVVVGSGGGSKQFEHFLEDTFGQLEIRENSIWDNAEGWAKVVGLIVN